MEEMRRLRIIANNAETVISFGIPVSDFELASMYSLRYQRYLERGYIQCLPECVDIDDHDLAGTCRYVVAVIEGKVVGAVRLIVEDQLPTPTYCFKLDKDPLEDLGVSCNRGEVSRLVTDPAARVPEHLLVIGLLLCLFDITAKEDIKGGFLYVHVSLKKILDYLGIPVHPIEGAELIYDRGYMHGYFYEAGEPVVPMYFLRDKVGEALLLLAANGGSVKRVWEYSS